MYSFWGLVVKLAIALIFLMLVKSLFFISKVARLLSITFPSAFVKADNICLSTNRVSITWLASSRVIKLKLASRGNPFSIDIYT